VLNVNADAFFPGSGFDPLLLSDPAPNPPLKEKNGFVVDKFEDANGDGLAVSPWNCVPPLVVGKCTVDTPVAANVDFA